MEENGFHWPKNQFSLVKIWSFFKNWSPLISVKKKIHIKSYRLNDNNLQCQYIKLKFWRQKWLPNERKKFMFESISIAWACKRLFKRDTFEGKINACIIFGLFLVTFLNLEIIIKLISTRNKFFFDSSFKNENVWDVFFQSMIKLYSKIVVPEQILRI